jgi:hypothetical protein
MVFFSRSQGLLVYYSYILLLFCSFATYLISHACVRSLVTHEALLVLFPFEVPLQGHRAVPEKHDRGFLSVSHYPSSHHPSKCRKSRSGYV